MSNFNLNQEWKFIESERSTLDEKSLELKLLDIAQVLLLNYENAKTEKV